MFDTEKTIDEQLEDLRRRWKTADLKGRKIIEIRAKLLKMKKPKDTIELAEEIFK